MNATLHASDLFLCGKYDARSGWYMGMPNAFGPDGVVFLHYCGAHAIALGGMKIEALLLMGQAGPQTDMESQFLGFLITGGEGYYEVIPADDKTLITAHKLTKEELYAYASGAKQFPSRNN